MRKAWHGALFGAGLLVAVAAIPVNAAEPPGEMPPIGIIEIYGLRTLSEDSVRALLPFEEGDVPRAEQAESLDSDLAAALKVHDVEIDGVCCDASGPILYIGIQEKAESGLRFEDPPRGQISLPGEIVASAEQFETTLMEAVNSGNAGDDFSEGHSLMDYPPAREIQQNFIGYANEHGELLRQVLHESADPVHRAIAAMVLAYSADKARVVADLITAAKDADPEVRNNAIRALSGIAFYANEHPELGISIPPGPFTGMLNSPVFGDRNKALLLLAALTEGGSPELLEELKTRALPALVEMCRWKSWGHAYSACLILQRIGGLSEKVEPGNREQLIEAVLSSSPP